MHRLRKNADFEAFQHDVIEPLRRDPIRIRSSRVLSNHWCFVVWPETDGQVTKKKGLFASRSLSSMPSRVSTQSG